MPALWLRRLLVAAALPLGSWVLLIAFPHAARADEQAFSAQVTQGAVEPSASSEGTGLEAAADNSETDEPDEQSDEQTDDAEAAPPLSEDSAEPVSEDSAEPASEDSAEPVSEDSAKPVAPDPAPEPASAPVAAPEPTAAPEPVAEPAPVLPSAPTPAPATVDGSVAEPVDPGSGDGDNPPPPLRSTPDTTTSESPVAIVADPAGCGTVVPAPEAAPSTLVVDDAGSAPAEVTTSAACAPMPGALVGPETVRETLPGPAPAGALGQLIGPAPTAEEHARTLCLHAAVEPSRGDEPSRTVAHGGVAPVIAGAVAVSARPTASPPPPAPLGPLPPPTPLPPLPPAPAPSITGAGCGAGATGTDQNQALPDGLAAETVSLLPVSAGGQRSAYTAAPVIGRAAQAALRPD